MNKTCHLSKLIDLELSEAKKYNDIERYVKARKLRITTSAFNKYRIKLIKYIFKKIKQPGNVLDIGCNIGALSSYYYAHSSMVVLCDLDRIAIEGARLYNSEKKRIRYLCADIRNLPFKSGFFDTIVSLETIEHVRNSEQKQTIEEMIRITKPGGNIIISTPNRFSLAGLEGRMIEFFVKKYRWKAWDDDHKHVYSSKDFLKFLYLFNRIIKIKMIHGSYFLPGSIFVRLPLWLQNYLGFISYVIARIFGKLFPFKYIGFTITVVCEKQVFD